MKASSIRLNCLFVDKYLIKTFSFVWKRQLKLDTKWWRTKASKMSLHDLNDGEIIRVVFFSSFQITLTLKCENVTQYFNKLQQSVIVIWLLWVRSFGRVHRIFYTIFAQSKNGCTKMGFILYSSRMPMQMVIGKRC